MNYYCYILNHEYQNNHIAISNEGFFNTKAKISKSLAVLSSKKIRDQHYI